MFSYGSLSSTAKFVFKKIRHLLQQSKTIQFQLAMSLERHSTIKQGGSIDRNRQNTALHLIELFSICFQRLYLGNLTGLDLCQFLMSWFHLNKSNIKNCSNFPVFVITQCLMLQFFISYVQLSLLIKLKQVFVHFSLCISIFKKNLPPSLINIQVHQ